MEPVSWVSIAAAILKLVSTIAPVFLLWLAKRAGEKQARAEIAADSNKTAAETQTEYAEILARDRDPADATQRMREGGY